MQQAARLEAATPKHAVTPATHVARRRAARRHAHGAGAPRGGACGLQARLGSLSETPQQPARRGALGRVRRRRAGKVARCGTPTVAKIFAAYPPKLRKRLLAVRQMIFDVAKQTEGVGKLQETLKWGEPAYVTTETGSGSTIRINRHKKHIDSTPSISTARHARRYVPRLFPKPSSSNASLHRLR